MLKFIEGLKYGTTNPLSLVRAETTKRVFAIDLSTHRNVKHCHTGGVNAIDIDSVEHRYMLSGSSDGSLVIHDLENHTSEPRYTCESICSVPRNSQYAHKYSIETVQWYPFDTGMFITSGMDKILRIWDTNTLIPADTYTCHGKIYCHHMSPIATKHSLIAVASESSQVSLVDLKSGSATHNLRGHKSSVICLQWAPFSEHILATGGMDNRVLFWDVRRAKSTLMNLDQHNGDIGASAEAINTAHNGNVNGLRFTLDGLFLVTYGTDNRLRLWNTSNGKNTMVNYGKIFNDERRAVKFDISYNASPDLIFVPTETRIAVYDMFSGDHITDHRAHYNSVKCCVYYSPYQELYSGGSDRHILVWLPESEEHIAYDEYLKTKETCNKSKGNSLVTVDTWSDEDD